MSDPAFSPQRSFWRDAGLVCSNRLRSHAVCWGDARCHLRKPDARPLPEQKRALLTNVRSKALIDTPERRALLNTIRYAEGTWSNGEDNGYRTLYGGGRFQDLSRHPEKVVVKRYSSAAAGAYQFLPTTWKGLAKELRLNSFEPKHQDQAALHLVKRRGALQEIDSRGLTTAAMAQLAPEWASFPTRSGRSA